MSSGEEAASLLVLWLGEHAAPEDELARRGIATHVLPSAASAAEIVALAPDLVVLSGTATAREQSLVRELAAAEPTAVPPVALLGKGGRSAPGARGGVVARLEASQAGPALAVSIESALARVHATAAHAPLTLDADGLDRYVAGLARDGRAGIWLRGTPPGAVVLGGDGTRVDALLGAADGPASMRFYERAPGKLRVLGAAGEPSAPSRLDGIAAILVDDGVRQWDPVVEALEGAGARVIVADAENEAIEKARTGDPALLIVPAAVLPTRAGLLLCEDARLASASLLVIDPRPGAELDAAGVLAAASRLCAGELAARARVREGGPLIERIETLGAVRWLKVLADAGAPVRLRLRSALGSGEIRLEGGKIREATYTGRDGSPPLRGGVAARALVAMARGTLLAGPLDAELHERRLAVAAASGPAAEVEAAPVDVAPPEAVVAAAPEDPIDEEVTTVAAAGEIRELLAKTASHPPPSTAQPSAAQPRVAQPSAAEVISAQPSAAQPHADEPGADEPGVDEPGVDEPGVDEPSVAPPAAERSSDARASAPSALPVTPDPPAAAPAPARPRTALYAVLGAAVLVAAAYVAIDHLGASTGDARAPDAPVASPPADVLAIEEPTTAAEPEPIDAPEVAPADPTTVDAPDPTEPTPGEVAGAAAPPPDAPTAEATAEPAVDPPVEAQVVAPPAADADADALVAQSDEAMRRREYPRALELAQQALALDPHHARAAYDSGLALLRLRRDEEAVTWAERAVGWDPSEPLYRLLLGDIHQQNGRRARAQAAWRACVEAEPLFAPCQRRLETAAPP